MCYRQQIQCDAFANKLLPLASHAHHMISYFLLALAYKACDEVALLPLFPLPPLSTCCVRLLKAELLLLPCGDDYALSLLFVYTLSFLRTFFYLTPKHYISRLF